MIRSFPRGLEYPSQYHRAMVSIASEDLPQAAVDLFARRARAAGVSSVTEQLRHEFIILAKRHIPLDNVIECIVMSGRTVPQPRIDDDASEFARVFRLPDETWGVLCLRAAVSGLPVSDYLRREITALARRVTIHDVMWEFVELQDTYPGLDIDIEAVLAATRYARALD
jgi:hypothetical protein